MRSMLAGDAVGVDGEVRQVVLDDVVERKGDVGGRERHAVLPFHALAGRERPGLAVGRHGPVGGKLGPRRQGLGVEAHQKVVVQVPDLVVEALDADEGVQVVGVLKLADAHDERAARRRGAGRRARDGQGGAGSDGNDRDGGRDQQEQAHQA
jgi:hypothetical protein